MSGRQVTIFNPPKDRIVTENKYNPPNQKWNMKQTNNKYQIEGHLEQ